MDELFASGIKLACLPEYSFIFEYGEETEVSKEQRYHLNCLSFKVCVEWAKHKKNASVLLLDIIVEMNYATGDFIGENSEPFCAS